MEHIREFYASPEYTAAKRLREGVAVARFIAVQGLAEESRWNIRDRVVARFVTIHAARSYVNHLLSHVQCTTVCDPSFVIYRFRSCT
jgi:hypothetical protein